MTSVFHRPQFHLHRICRDTICANPKTCHCEMELNSSSSIRTCSKSKPSQTALYWVRMRCNLGPLTHFHPASCLEWYSHGFLQHIVVNMRSYFKQSSPILLPIVESRILIRCPLSFKLVKKNHIWMSTLFGLFSPGSSYWKELWIKKMIF